MALIEIERRARSYSQNGEDLLLARIFGDRPRGTMLDVGAHDGTTFSNSALLEERGWATILVEPNPDLCAVLRERRKGILFECAASDAEGEAELEIGGGDAELSSLDPSPEHRRRMGQSGRKARVRVRTLDGILADAGVQTVDVVSVDVEGHELAVLRGLSLARWRPRVLVVEDNSCYADDGVPCHLAREGYVRFARTGCNDWYARRDDGELARLRYRVPLAGRRALRKVALCGHRVLPAFLVRALRPVAQKLMNRIVFS